MCGNIMWYIRPTLVPRLTCFWKWETIGIIRELHMMCYNCLMFRRRCKVERLNTSPDAGLLPLEWRSKVLSPLNEGGEGDVVVVQLGGDHL